MREALIAMKEVTLQIEERSSRYIEYLLADGERHDSKNHIIMNTLPMSALPIKVAKGWIIQQEYLGVDQDIFVCHAKKGFKLPEHAHLQKETIEVLSGELHVYVRGVKTILNAKESIVIDSYVPHYCIAPQQDTIMRITFKPPITKKMDSHATT